MSHLRDSVPSKAGPLSKAWGLRTYSVQSQGLLQRKVTPHRPVSCRLGGGNSSSILASLKIYFRKSSFQDNFPLVVKKQGITEVQQWPCGSEHKNRNMPEEFKYTEQEATWILDVNVRKLRKQGKETSLKEHLLTSTFIHSVLRTLFHFFSLTLCVQTKYFPTYVVIKYFIKPQIFCNICDTQWLWPQL